MNVSWTGPLFGRLACLLIAFAIMGGTAWWLSANAVNQGPTQPPVAAPAVPKASVAVQAPAPAPPAREFAPKAPPVAEDPLPVKPTLTEPPPAPVVKEPVDPKPAPPDPDKGGPPPPKRLVLEVDLSKLPPDLVKQLQGAIIEKRDPGKAPAAAPEGKQPPNQKP
jgi:hypothetical protein